MDRVGSWLIGDGLVNYVMERKILETGMSSTGHMQAEVVAEQRHRAWQTLHQGDPRLPPHPR